MIVFDNDVTIEILQGDPTFLQRASTVPQSDQAVPIIVVEETMRGRLNDIRQAEAASGAETGSGLVFNSCGQL